MDYLNRWIDSMPERIKQAIGREGGLQSGNSCVWKVGRG